MNSLINAAWPYTTDGVSYHQEGHGSIKVLQVYTENSGGPQVDLVDQTTEELMHRSEITRRYYLRLVVITRSYKTMGTSHTKVAHYNISQEDLTNILRNQGLASFYRQTRVDVAGVLTSSLSPGDHKDHQDGDYFGLIYDAHLGLWARYDSELKQWQGIYILPVISLDIKSIAEELISFARSKMFLHLLAARFIVDFLGIRSGELPGRVAEIERHSGYHSSVLRPVPATYAKLEKMSADATATANLVSYLKIVISHLADDLLRYLEEACGHDDMLRTDVQQHVINLRQRLKSLSTYMTYLERRAERQITATLHLVNEANASTNLAVAHDTRVIAVANKHDSSSMKMLAAVTTTFLPGAFVASLFSMNMFNWFASDGAPVISERFWVYWSVTIPLTLITVGLWLGWEYGSVSKQQERRRFSIMESAGLDKRVLA
jgi:Mg2+ and Co2+ transporter CorA